MTSSHAYAQPSECDAVQALADVFGERQGHLIWEKACLTSGVNRHNVGLSLDSLELVVEYLKRWPGLAGVIGTSIGVRISTFRASHARQPSFSST